MTEDQDRWARLDQKLSQLPQSMIDQFKAALVNGFARVLEGDRPLREHIEKARRLGNEDAADVAAALRASELYDDASPDRMSKLAAVLAPIPDPRGRPETWGEPEYLRMDEYFDNGMKPTSAARKIAREDGSTMAGQELKDFVDARVKAWRLSSPARARRKCP